VPVAGFEHSILGLFVEYYTPVPPLHNQNIYNLTFTLGHKCLKMFNGTECFEKGTVIGVLKLPFN
jgi:hypothetical protein